MWLIRGIGKMLRFQAYGIAKFMRLTFFSDIRPVQEIPGINLDPGLGGFYLHDAP